MKTESMPLVVGLPGTTLGAEEKAVLERIQPAGVILFSRNISTPEQVRELVGAIRELEPRPFVTADLEGGVVNRLSGLWGELPTAAAAGAAGRRAVRSLGEAAGAACRNLGIHLDLAPVVDLDCPGGCLGGQERCFSDDPERVAVLARVFNEGLAEWGVSGCTKHFPGLGPVPADTHKELPVLELDEAALERHMAVFAKLGPEFPAVMVGHVVVPGLGDAEQPAKLPGSPVVLADDLEMGALDGVGDLPERVVAAVHARNHGVLVCNAFDRLDDIMTRLNDLSSTDSTLGARWTEMSARMGTLRRDLLQRSAAVPAPDDTTVEQLWQQARREAAQ
jgi:beta-N-acetylhexosaminidase